VDYQYEALEGLEMIPTIRYHFHREFKDALAESIHQAFQFDVLSNPIDDLADRVSEAVHSIRMRLVANAKEVDRDNNHESRENVMNLIRERNKAAGDSVSPSSSD
jgi:aminoglycoside phosphotransferase